MVIQGIQYTREMKNGLFSAMHYLMPKRQILSLHSGCNMGRDGDGDVRSIFMLNKIDVIIFKLKMGFDFNKTPKKFTQ